MSCCKICEIKQGQVFYRAHTEVNPPFNKETREKDDWKNSVCMSENEKRLHDWTDEQHPYPMKIIAKRTIKYINCTHECFKEGNYKNYMVDIINEIQELIQKKKDSTTPFMCWLGENGYAFRCFETKEGDIEMIVPYCLFNKENWDVHSLWK